MLMVQQSFTAGEQVGEGERTEGVGPLEGSPVGPKPRVHVPSGFLSWNTRKTCLLASHSWIATRGLALVVKTSVTCTLFSFTSKDIYSSP